MTEQKTNRWMIVAVIFILLFVIETVVFIGMWTIGVAYVKGDEACGAKCYDLDAAYFYDNYREVCYCYKGHVEVARYEDFKG